MEEENIYRESFPEINDREFETLSPLATDLVHEIGNPLSVITGHLELNETGESPLLEDESEEANSLLEEFAESAEYLKDHTNLYRTIPVDEVEEMADYAGDPEFPDEFSEHAHRITSISKDVHDYQQKLVSDESEDNVEIGEMLESLEHCAEGIAEAETDFEYNGLEDSETGVGRGMNLVFWTLGKNWEKHSGPVDGEYELGFEVEQDGDGYTIEVWNTGEGFFDKYPGDGDTEKALRHLEAVQHMRDSDYGSHGLGMAADIAEVYGGKISYTEDRLDGKGFGLEIKIPGPETQSDTSESSYSG